MRIVALTLTLLLTGVAFTIQASERADETPWQAELAHAADTDVFVEDTFTDTSGKLLQDHFHKITKDTEKRVPSKEEMAKYKSEFGGRLEGTLKDLDRETREMEAALKQVEAKHAKVGLEIKRNLRDANTEFQQIVGGRS